MNGVQFAARPLVHALLAVSLPILAQAQEAAEPEPWVAAAGVEELRRALFTVVIEHEDDRTGAARHEGSQRVQVGFLVGADLGITSYDGLSQAKRIEASFDGRRKVALQLVASDPREDLALVQLRDRSADAAEGRLPLMLEPLEGPALAVERWTLYMDPRSPERAEAVPLARILEGQLEDPELSETLALRAGSKTRLLGGLPIVDAAGRLAGMWRWSWLEGGWGEPRVVAAEALCGMVAAFAADGSGRGPSFGSSAARSMTFPLLAWSDRGGNSPATSAVRSCKDFVDRVGCSHCGKLGYRIRKWKEIVGTRVVYHEDKETCGRCEGEKLSDPKKIWSEARTLAALITKVAAGPEIEKVGRALEEGVRDAAALAPAEFLRRLHDAAVEELRNPVPGRSLMFVVQRESWPSERLAGWGEDVRLLETLVAPLLLVAPQGRNVIQEGYDALVVGTVAGRVTEADRQFIVVERAIAVPIQASDTKIGR